MQTIAIVVPCYNEEKRLQRRAFLQALDDVPALHFFFVNDGSRDQTLALLHDMERERPDRIHALSLPQNKGKAEAVRNGMLQALDAGHDFVGFWDADLATPLHYIPAFADLLQTQEGNIVIGARVRLLGRSIDRQPVRHYLGRLFATCASLLLRLSVYDTQCGAKLFRNIPAVRYAFQKPFHVDWVFDVEVFARLLQYERHFQGPSIEATTIEFPLREWTDVPGSKVKPTHFLRGGLDLIQIARQLYLKEPPPPQDPSSHS